MAENVTLSMVPQFVVTVVQNMDTTAGFAVLANTDTFIITAEIGTGGSGVGGGHEFTDEYRDKLAAIEPLATTDQTGAEIKVLYEAEPSAFTDAQFTKLAAVEAGATADQTNAEIRTAVEAALDSNVFTDADHTKLDGVETGAKADQTGGEIKTAYELEANTNAYTDTEKTKLAGIETGAAADQSNAEIKTAYEANTNTNAYTDTEKTKLTGIETGATADQTAGEIETGYNAQVAQISAPEIAAGTETAIRRVSPADLKSIAETHGGGGGGGDPSYGAPLATTIALTALTEASLTDKDRRFVEAEIADFFYNAEAVSGDYAPDDQTAGTGWWLKAVASGDSAASIKTKYESNADTNAFQDAEKTKLGTVETSAAADQTGAEIKTAYELEADTNAYDDAAVAKLAAIEASATADQSDGEIETAYNTQVAKVSAGEITAGTEVAVRRYSPADIVAIIAAHESGGGASTSVNNYVLDHTLALTDATDIVEMEKATAIVLTIPTNAVVAFPIGTIITISMMGVGILTLTASATVTLNGVSAGSGAFAAQFDGASIYKRGTNEWVVQGAIGTVA